VKKDLLSMPAESFFWSRITGEERNELFFKGEKIRKPYSLILSQATVADFRELWGSTSSYHSSDSTNFIHFSLFDCWEEKNKFKNSSVLTVNTETGNYKWRKPYNDRTLPK